jgi:hypothetical protein
MEVSYLERQHSIKKVPNDFMGHLLVPEFFWQEVVMQQGLLDLELLIPVH